MPLRRELEKKTQNSRDAMIDEMIRRTREKLERQDGSDPESDPEPTPPESGVQPDSPQTDP